MVDDVLIDAFMVTDFVNLKIKPTQSFRDVYRSRVHVRMPIKLNAHTCMRVSISILCS
jgi:hypothetical protein